MIRCNSGKLYLTITAVKNQKKMSNCCETSRPKVLVTHPKVPEVGVNILREKCEVTLCEGFPQPSRKEILEKVKGMDGILWATHSPINAEALDAAGPQLKSLSTMSSGLDYVDIEEVKRRNIPLGYSPTVLNDAVGDMAMGLMVAAARRFREGRLAIENSTWHQQPQFLLGRDIKDSTVGVVGFGNIGQTIVKRLQGFEIGKVLYSGHSPKPEAEKYRAEFVSFDELLEKSDFVFVSTPLTKETKLMFNESAFSKMKPTSVFVNCARGDLVDQEALYNALKNKKIFAAALDVMTPEPLPPTDKILALPNAFILPHLSSATIRARDDMSCVAAHNVLCGLVGEPMFSAVYKI